MFEAKTSAKKRCRILKQPIFHGKSAGIPRCLEYYESNEQQSLFPAINITSIILMGKLKSGRERACDRVKLVWH